MATRLQAPGGETEASARGEYNTVNTRLHRYLLTAWLGLVAIVAWSCGSDNMPAAPDQGGAQGGQNSTAVGSRAGSTNAGNAGTAGSIAGVAGAAGNTHACSAADATPLPWRLVTSNGAVAQPTQTPVFVQDLFDSFRAYCGACHVEATSGNLKVTQNSFSTTVDEKAIDRILATDPALMMPPKAAGGMLASARAPGDPVLEFAERLKQWIAAGRPRDVYYIASAPTGTPTNDATYRMVAELAQGMTNIGNCVPDPSIVATEKLKMAELDQRFAQMARKPAGQGTAIERIGLPEHLRDTDQFTFDTELLAKNGVLAYVPAYPLWTDDAGKLRFVRVPLGQSIHYNATTKTFNIPDNTRFYKTFFREIIEVDGVKRNKKVETRLLVTRQDVTQTDGSIKTTALFGTYVWNEDETDAVLLSDPLRNGEPFRDRLITIITDEVTAAAVRAKNPVNLAYALENANATRRYALPGSERCIGCHMGSQSQDFVLGFLPIQMHHRPKGQAGRIEASGRDELSQMQRLIDYGLITGVPNDPAQWPLLENSQGSRSPRNDLELVAQGYLLGNCAHCHNPRGVASSENPVLLDVLDFLPSEKGGIFQFPLDKTSPRISRGKSANVAIPYVTPSLVDYPVTDDPSGSSYTPKSDVVGNWSANPLVVNDRFTGLPTGSGVPQGIVFAPWRSLVYRNVDTPFTYSDHFTLFPHMPMHSPGTDCRAHRILGDWMVSIPAARKHPQIWEFASTPTDGQPCELGTSIRCDTESQPYVEVKPGEAGFEAAQAEAATRLTMFHSGLPSWFVPWSGPVVSRYDYCPDNRDIVDRSVGTGAGCSVKTVPESAAILATSTTGSNVLVMPNLGVPLRTHFVVTDLTDTPGDYQPRRADWSSILVDDQFTTITGQNCSTEQARQDDEKRVVGMLANVSVTPTLREYATTEIPFGVWKAKPQCDLSKLRTVDSYVGQERPKWMSSPNAGIAPTDRVYTETPGAMVFKMVCINCHGARADSQGRLAENLMTMTGGTVRVANLRDGLFGPATAPSSNYQAAFSAGATKVGVTSEDLASRYLTWMALGGTKARIPPSILNIVGNTQVLGVARNGTAFESVTAKSANMLATAQELCRHVLPWQPGHSSVAFDPMTGKFDLSNSALIGQNGDAEMWQKLCSMGNAPPIRALVGDGWSSGAPSFVIVPIGNLYRPEGYPANTPVGDHLGRVRSSVETDNWLPWCVVKPTESTAAAAAESYVASHPLDGGTMPFCPPSLLVAQFRMQQDSLEANDLRDLENWATRGAINAGFAVFQYLQQTVSHGLSPKPSNDRCEQLAP